MKFLKKHIKLIKRVFLSTACFAALMMVLFSFKETWAFSIDLYQRFVSPHKGYHCAYRAWHHDISCSEYGKQEIASVGVLEGLILLHERFAGCQLAAEKIKLAARPTEKRNAAVTGSKTKNKKCCRNSNNPCAMCCGWTLYGKAYRDSLDRHDSLRVIEDSVKNQRAKEQRQNCKKSCKECGGEIGDIWKGCLGCCGDWTEPPEPPLPPNIFSPGTN
ncbi:MAG: membrane protein insertion efficiency factor YidD [Patescibacteria group bacterium]|nr:membrane protein insertion efficiency factor YidD [Patescibacteria group bacterium]